MKISPVCCSALWFVILSPLPQAYAQAAPASACYATVQEAAESVVASGSASRSQTGFRIQTLVTDSVLHRAWLRVESCEHPERVAQLVPLHAGIFDRAPMQPGRAPVQIDQGLDTVTGPTEGTTKSLLIASGQAVTIHLETLQTHMILHGRTAVSAHLGEMVDVVLDNPLSNETAPRQMRGQLMAQDRVEVRS